MKRADLVISVRRYNIWRDNDDIEHQEPTEEVISYTCESVHVSFDGSVIFFSSGKDVYGSSRRREGNISLCQWRELVPTL